MTYSRLVVEQREHSRGHALDRRRRQSIQRLRVDEDGESLCLVVEGGGDLEPEAEAFHEKGQLLMRLLDRPLGLVLS